MCRQKLHKSIYPLPHGTFVQKEYSMSIPRYKSMTNNRTKKNVIEHNYEYDYVT